MADVKSKSKSKSTQSKSKLPAINGTRLELTLAAEKVFALNGIRGATQRQIREEAGQKNESVIHYHFGSQDAIIESVLHLHSKPMDQLRQDMLAKAQAESSGHLISSEQVVRCLLLPLAHYLLDRRSPGYYLRFLVQLRADRAAWRKFSGVHDKGLRRCLSALRDAKPYLPTAIVNQRYANAVSLHLSGMAVLEQIISEKGAKFRSDEGWVRVEDLITTTSAMIDAPLSPATVEAIQYSAEYQPSPSYHDVSLRRSRPEE
ncbi:TetR/AcrR family transcriptional regulator [Marinobacter salexigens]|uniref:TetR/AcrR family transcriptional regulator n=1 Tax=Marinobacter salexigens TaxID=1925763 RepID=A0ABS6ABP2_9GAMM|nr:TetR/AcrR family transcriptional regulator [Marinobacter salexigens]